ncbi:MAG: tripartite tricarboxylate transporter substrate binding protein [Rhodospirillales bacterium]|nr:tripartite tricarboxylate transporter substrate binding protein [Rhodospirillales bacterium]
MKLTMVAKTLGIAATAIGMVAVSSGLALAKYPERPIQIIIPWGAGGGTDATGRIIGTVLQKELGVPVNVVNRTGGQGVVGHSAIATADPDGYTLGVVTVEIAMMHWVGLTELSYKDYTPIGLYNADPAGVQVRADSPWKDVKDMLAAVKAAPGKHKGSGTSQGGIWHLALAGMLRAGGLDPNAVPWVPSDGAASGLKELVASGVDIVTCSPTEAAPLTQAGKVKILAVMNDTRMDAFPDVPTLKEAAGFDWNIGAWRSLNGPKGLPKEVMDVLVPAFKKVVDSAEFKDFMAKRGFPIVYRDPAGLTDWSAASDKNMGEVLKAVGIAK